MTRRAANSFDMPPLSAGFDKRGGWVVNRLMGDFPGSKDFHCAGVVGNLGGESGLQAINEYGGGPGFGWAQWSFDRRDSFEVFCSQHGYAATDDQANYEYLLVEMRSTEAHAWQQTLKTSTLKAATDTFMRDFERPADPVGTLPSRVEFAQRALEASKALPQPGPVAPSGPRKPLKTGSRGLDVKLIQIALQIPADGIFGKQTRAAVVAFQKANKIRQTGTCAKQTWSKLFSWDNPP